ncbi:MAG: KTSC domain-containing protein [Candidatus Eremiobacteraeota bacterium]|nr:KTSC domain-containing protein [Candidatus Eremiobacteraeota bacterium]
MKRDPVVSSNLASLGYDADARILEVAFHPGRSGESGVWQYRDVGPALFEELRTAPSIGRTFSIIRSRHRGLRVATITPDGVEHRSEDAS